MEMSCGEKVLPVMKVKRMLDMETGEIVDTAAVIHEPADYDFEKLWLMNFIAAAGIIGGKSMEFTLKLFALRNRSSNTIHLTISQMSQMTGIARRTVDFAIKKLKAADVLRKAGNGLYMINPLLIYKGEHDKRMWVSNVYAGAMYKPPADAEKLESLHKARKAIEEAIERLEGKRKAGQASEKKVIPLPTRAAGANADEERSATDRAGGDTPSDGAAGGTAAADSCTTGTARAVAEPTRAAGRGRPKREVLPDSGAAMKPIRKPITVSGATPDEVEQRIAKREGMAEYDVGTGFSLDGKEAEMEFIDRNTGEVQHWMIRQSENGRWTAEKRPI